MIGCRDSQNFDTRESMLVYPPLPSPANRRRTVPYCGFSIKSIITLSYPPHLDQVPWGPFYIITTPQQSPQCCICHPSIISYPLQNQMEKVDYSKELIETARKICTPGKGILAADESPGSVAKKFDVLKIENVEENRRRYREMLLTSAGIEDYISGVILQEETAKQATKDGKLFITYLQDRGIVAGIKVDKGLAIIEGNKNEENFTKGLDVLAAMAKEFYGLGCRFAKWRAVLKISDGCPSDEAIRRNAEDLASYAVICQENGLVPIVEPEILPDGDHDAVTSQKVTEKVLAAVFKAMNDKDVLLEGALLKPNMVTYGQSHKNRQENNIQEEAYRTVQALSRTVPPALAGVVFLSGGQSEEEASLHLNAMNVLKELRAPWFLTFSFGRALQNTAIKTWTGQDTNLEIGQKAFLVRAKANGEAQLGKYVASTDKAANESLFIAGHRY